MDEEQPLIGTSLSHPPSERRSTVITIAGAGNNFRLIQKRSRSILEKSYVDLLLVFVPLGVVAGFVKWPPSVVFALNFLALISLENVFHLVAERLFLPWGDRPGTILSVILPHVFPLFIGATAVGNGQIELAQTFVIGSLLCNHLLGLGLCFIISSFNQQESIFPATGTNTEACLLYIIATPFAMCKLLSAEFLPPFLPGDYDDHKAVLFLSRGSAIVLLLIYILFLYFRLQSHRYLWASEQNIDALDYYDDDDRLSFSMSVVHVVGLAIVVVLALVCTRSLVTSVPRMVDSAVVPLTNTFTGLIILPIITHLCKYIKTTIIAYQGHPEIAVAMTLGSSVDVAFFALPVLVLVGWMVGQDMTMEFQLLETIIVVLSILVMAGFVMDGKSNYLEGSMSIGLFAIIVVTYAVIPDPPLGS